MIKDVYSIEIGMMVRPAFNYCNMWAEDGCRIVDVVGVKDTLLIVSHKKMKEKHRLNNELYVHVLAPSGRIGWIHTDELQSLH